MSDAVFSLLLSLAAVAMAGSLFWSGLRDGRNAALSLWALSLLLAPAGWLIYRLHAPSEETAMAILGKSLVAAAFTLQYCALTALVRPAQPLPRWALLVPVAVVLLCVVHWLLWPLRPLGSGLLSVIGSWMALLCAARAYRLDRAGEANAHGRILALNFCSVGIILMLRAALLLLPAGTLFPAPLAQALSQDWLIALALLAPIIGSLNLALIERDRLTQRYRLLASQDALTSLASRRHLYERGEACFARAQAELRALAVVMIDVDNFKAINDQCGHDHGDQVLQQIGAMIAQSLRSNDVAGRTGGDEFVAVLPDASMEDALIVAERIRRRVDTERSPRVTVSLGCAVRQPDDHSLDSLLRRADQAMYSAKHSGRNRVSHIHRGLAVVPALTGDEIRTDGSHGAPISDSGRRR